MRVDLVADGSADPGFREHGEQGRIERARPDRRINEAHLLALPELRLRIPH